jgi:hypothetical protein
VKVEERGRQAEKDDPFENGFKLPSFVPRTRVIMTEFGPARAAMRSGLRLPPMKRLPRGGIQKVPLPLLSSHQLSPLYSLTNNQTISAQVTLSLSAKISDNSSQLIPSLYSESHDASHRITVHTTSKFEDPSIGTVSPSVQPLS